ncbi:MAG: hypothetical protein GX417_01505 [Clostridiales bacterium]|nr:hypothetical protein [Clostridiales bacterium]
MDFARCVFSLPDGSAPPGRKMAARVEKSSENLHAPMRYSIGSAFVREAIPMSFGESLLIAVFIMAVVFFALFALYLFVTLFSLIVEVSEHAAKRKKITQ